MTMRQHIDLMTFLETLTDDDHKFALDYIDWWATGIAGTRTTTPHFADAPLVRTLQMLLPYQQRVGTA